jgi:hypothetical protein
MIQPPQWKSKVTGQEVIVADGWDSSNDYYVAVWLDEDRFLEKAPDVKLKISEFLEAFVEADDL